MLHPVDLKAKAMFWTIVVKDIRTVLGLTT
jgi:hypothetical protein